MYCCKTFTNIGKMLPGPYRSKNSGAKMPNGLTQEIEGHRLQMLDTRVPAATVGLIWENRLGTGGCPSAYRASSIPLNRVLYECNG